ncbi:hypothetical protein COCNU_scaffold000643G000020 [Cocos nucifera]|nr:hypothetical protein [Cocos nucifera]
MEEAQSYRASDPNQQQPPPSKLNVWVNIVGGKKKGRIYGLGLESTVLIGPSYFYGQASSCSQWMQNQQLQEQVRKLETEWNSWVEVAERERDELKRRVEHNKKVLEANNKLLRELLAKINFQPSSSFQASSNFQPSPSQPLVLRPYAPSYPERDDDIEEEEEERYEDTD